ncbi:MAG TPA: Hsp20/alpha crystallin family protein [Ktedonobacteraceae bacterium]|jgi:HSP20 family protein|nr:Hsp20/alpha crystallin family protein [Ktedonobacteraceae bacterium]
MAMMKRDPFDALMPLREAMNRLFEESFIGPRFEFLTGRTFPLDVYESEDKQKYVVEASLPGLKIEDIQVTAEGDTLSIRVAKREETKVEKGNYMRHERYEGEMDRMITLPSTIEPANVQAEYEHGVLKITIPKSATIASKQIPIRVKETTGSR